MLVGIRDFRAYAHGFQKNIFFSYREFRRTVLACLKSDSRIGSGVAGYDNGLLYLITESRVADTFCPQRGLLLAWGCGSSPKEAQASYPQDSTTKLLFGQCNYFFDLNPDVVKYCISAGHKSCHTLPWADIRVIGSILHNKMGYPHKKNPALHCKTGFLCFGGAGRA